MENLREIMNLESLWTVWFWVAHVLAWSLSSHFVLGVPFDAVQQAQREKEPGPWSAHVDAMIKASVFRYVSYFRRSGALIVGMWCFILASAATFALGFGNEFSLALLTLFVPLTFIYGLSIRWALWMDRVEMDAAGRRKAVRRLRFWIQLFGVLGILGAALTAVYYWIQIHVPLGPI